MARSLAWKLAGVWVLLAVGLTGGVSGPVRAAGMGGRTVKESLQAGGYVLTLRIGPVEQMYSSTEARKKHPKDGEVMIGGKMMDMSMGTMPNHHLELSIVSRATHRVVTKATVLITIYTAKGMLVAHVPVAEMRGVRGGPSDTHFGNNVLMKNGSYRVTVRVNSTPATFKVTLGGSTMMGM